MMDREELTQLVGEYYSVELDATYEIVMRDELYVVLPNGNDARFEQRGADQFAASGWNVTLQRDGAGKVIGFVLDAGRVRGLAFVRQ